MVNSLFHKKRHMHFSFYLLKKIEGKKNDFFGQIDLFSVEFFCKSGQGGPGMADSNSLSSSIDYFIRNKQILFNGS